MRQVLQRVGSGDFELVEVPCPRVKPGHLLVQTRTSLVSAGTERMLLEFGRANWLERARQQPDRVRQVLDKAAVEGWVSAWEAVRSKLDQEIPLGYANAGRVVEVGPGVRGWRPGDRVLSNGPHAELVAVPANLSARIPAGVSDDEAPFGVLAAIALQGLRLAEPSLGESFVVTGLGLVGLLAAQLLRANGCHVLGLDPDPERLSLAASWGVTPFQVSPDTDPVRQAMDWSRGRGVDGVLIAAATTSAEPVRQAAAMCRRKGRIVLTGVAGLDLSRDLFYKKELSFQVSCSYGPGRYDPAYERDGHDYPLGEVRWTAQRNMEAALEAMEEGRLEVEPLISHRFPFSAMADAYGVLLGGGRSLGLLLAYGPPEQPAVPVPVVRHRPVSSPLPETRPSAIAVIGAGEYATRHLFPLLARSGVRLSTVVSESGSSAASAARRFGFEQSATETASIWSSGAEAVFVATRHDSHAQLAIEALEAGLAVWVEKPLVTSEAELRAVMRACDRRLAAGHQPCLMVGFNRRFSPWVEELASELRQASAHFEFRYLVNAGTLEPGHWALDRRQGGGRVLGECCHFIDLLRYLAGSPIRQLEARSAGEQGARLWLQFENGSSGSIDYLTGGARSFPKERLEVVGGGRIWVLNNFRSLERHGGRWPRRPGSWGRWWRGPSKGQSEAVSAFLASVRRGEAAPIPLDEVLEVAQWSLTASRLAS